MLSAGVAPPKDVLLIKHNLYDKQAVIPRLPWRMPTLSEKRMLFVRSDQQQAENLVRVFTLPKKIIPHLTLLINLESPEKLQFVLEQENVKQGINLIREFIESLRIKDTPSSEYGIGWNASDQATVTFGNGGFKEGLHIDNQRDTTMERILVNLGAESRYFLFINLSINQLRSLISKSDASLVKNNSGRSSIGRMFMHLFPNYPVTKLRIEPGELYIAPTESLVHDGCTQRGQNINPFFTMRAIFQSSTQQCIPHKSLDRCVTTLGTPHGSSLSNLE